MSTPPTLMRDDAAVDSRDTSVRIEDRVTGMDIANDQPAPPQHGTSATAADVGGESDGPDDDFSDLDEATRARIQRELQKREERAAKRLKLALEQKDAVAMSTSSASSISAASAPTTLYATTPAAYSYSSSSSTSSSSSYSAPTQPYADLATVQRKLENVENELTEVKAKITAVEAKITAVEAEITVVKTHRNKLRADGNDDWRIEDVEFQRLLDDKKLLMQEKKLLMEKEAGLMQDIRRLRERAERAAAAAAPQNTGLEDLGGYDPGPWPPATAPAAGDRSASVSASAASTAPPTATATATATAVNLPDLFDTSMRRVALLSTLLRSRLRPAMATELHTAEWRTAVDNKWHERMNIFIASFLELRQSKGATESLLHARNDCLFHIIKHSSGIPLSLNRDAHSSSTAAGTRPDCHLAVRDWAPLVLVEEKANEGELVVAINELRTKFRWLPHYGNLPFVFAIAIAGDTIEFGRLDKSHAYMAFPGPGANGLARFCTAEEESLRGALNCIHAAINIGRCIRVMSTEFTMHLLHQPFNEVIHRHNKTLRITFEQVEKRYDPVRAVDRARMTAFYAETAGVECLEKGEVVDQPIRRGRAANDADDADDARNRSITFHLRPVGINALPLSSDTEGIRRCLKDLLTALSGVHALGWVVGDLRKPNVVLARAPRTTVKRYFVIDAAEYACRVGEELNEDKLDAAPHGWTGGGIATAQWDLRMLWDMVAAEKYDTRAIRSMPHGEEFCAWLSGRFARSGGEEKSAADLLAHPFLDGVVPEPF